ncbi:MAG: thioredoxin domain-containing protein, partial [Actinomycetota bacterium]
MQKGTNRLVIGAVAVAILVAGLMVVLSQIDRAGSSQEAFADIPQDGTRLGNENAPVTIHLYEDFQCPACGIFARETLPDVVERYVEPGEVKIVSETLAFLGPDSVPAARAAIAAGGQDRYWQYAILFF